MRMHALRATLAIAVLVALPPARAGVTAQAPWVLEWLQAYANGQQSEIVERFRTVSSLKQLQEDLDKVAPKWLEGPAGLAELHRRAIVAFAIDAAFVRLDQGPQAGKLAEWSCRQLRRHTPPDDFDHRAHMAVFAVLAGAVDPDALETHVTHVKFQFPNEPRLALERAIAEDLRGAPFYQPGKQLAADIVRHKEEAARRYAEAAKIDATRGEASLRLAHVSNDLGKSDDALKALDQADPVLKDPSLIYLAKLFRGMALERLGRLDDARVAYGQALAIRPEAQSASLSLAELTLRQGDHVAADRMVQEVLRRSTTPDDPWWDYWPGDYRLGADLLRVMREAVR
ncbi:MAG: tetratricopeptide repeat protein [Vicinamibacterales bacterium]